MTAVMLATYPEIFACGAMMAGICSSFYALTFWGLDLP